jgi:hypothetical protein
MFELHQNYQDNVQFLPNSQHQVTIIDNALSNPDAVTEYARNTAYFNKVGTDNTFYPGIRDKMPRPYLRFLDCLIRELVIKGTLTGNLETLDVYRSELSLTTLSPEKLHLFQKMPHIDCLDADEYAVVHYFCSDNHGGTSLYKYKPLAQIELNSEDEVHQMIEQVEAHQASHSGYIDGDTPLFERVLQVPPRFNRIAIYKGNLLHSADLSNPINQINDLDIGRLTIASFFNLAP